MSPTTASTTDAADVSSVSCSFCGKPDTLVQRLVAGPGVYICDECVQLSAAVIEEATRVTPEESARRRARYVDRPTEEILATLPALLAAADRVEAELAGWIDRLRGRGADWHTIAGAAGVPTDALRRRFERPAASDT